MPDILSGSEESDFKAFTEEMERLSEAELRIILALHNIDLDERLKAVWERVAETLWPLLIEDDNGDS